MVLGVTLKASRHVEVRGFSAEWKDHFGKIHLNEVTSSKYP